MLIQGDIENLNTLITNDQDLKNEKSPLGHRASLIHYIGSNGIEIWRQIVPPNIEFVLQYLIELNFDLNPENNIYGGSTLVDLINTSGHPKSLNKTEYLLKLLK